MIRLQRLRKRNTRSVYLQFFTLNFFTVESVSFHGTTFGVVYDTPVELSVRSQNIRKQKLGDIVLRQRATKDIATRDVLRK